MRRASVALGASALCLSAVYAGCVDSDETTPALSIDGGSLEASTPDSTTPTPEASLPETSLPDVTSAAVTVVATRGGAPVAGATVVFHDASGAALDTATTDSAGRATRASAVAGMMVTVVFGSPASPELLTIVGVEAGDVLLAADPASDTAAPQPDLNVQSGPTAPAATSYYELRAGRCRTSTSTFPALIGLGLDCLVNGSTSVVVEARNATDAVIGYTAARNIPIADAGDAGASVAITSPFVDAGVGTITATGFASTAQGRATYMEVVDGLGMTWTDYVGGEPDGGPVLWTYATHGTLATAYQHEVVERSPSAGGAIAYRAIATRSGVQSATLDLASVPGVITNLSLDGGTKPRPFVSWTAPTGAADGIAARFRWGDPGSDAAAYVGGRWTFVLPPGTSSFTAPALPAAVAAFAPSPTADVIFPPIVAIVDATAIPGYRELRQGAGLVVPTRSLATDSFGNIAPMLPGDGTVRLTAVTEPGD